MLNRALNIVETGYAASTLPVCGISSSSFFFGSWDFFIPGLSSSAFRSLCVFSRRHGLSPTDSSLFASTQPVPFRPCLYTGLESGRFAPYLLTRREVCYSSRVARGHPLAPSLREVRDVWWASNQFVRPPAISVPFRAWLALSTSLSVL